MRDYTNKNLKTAIVSALNLQSAPSCSLIFTRSDPPTTPIFTT